MSLIQEEYEKFSKRAVSFNPENPGTTRECQTLKADREVRWQQWTDRAILDQQGRIIEFQSVGRDITERKRAEEERVRLATAIEQATEAIMITGTDSVIQYVNPAFESLSGYGKREIVGQHPRVLKSGKHDRYFYKDIRDTLSR
jgi:PAS domain-containing protein